MKTILAAICLIFLSSCAQHLDKETFLSGADTEYISKAALSRNPELEYCYSGGTIAFNERFGTSYTQALNRHDNELYDKMPGDEFRTIWKSITDETVNNYIIDNNKHLIMPPAGKCNEILAFYSTLTK